MQTELPYRICRADINDAEEILNLQKICYKREAERNNNFSIPPLTQTLEEIKKDFDTHLYLKALFKDKIIGSVKGILDKEHCQLLRLIVHPDHQRKGLGRRLMKELENNFPSAKYMNLFTGEKSFENINLYESEGYSIYKKEHLPGTDITLVYMEKPIRRF